MNTYVVFLQILPLLLGAAISPVATTGMIAELSQKNKPITRGFLYLLGTAIPLLIIGLPGIFLFSHLSIQSSSTRIDSWVDLLAGLALLIVGIKVLVSPSKSSHTHHAQSKKSVSILQTIGLGSALMVTNFSTLVLFFPAIKSIADSQVEVVQKLGLLILSIVVTLSIIALPLIIRIVLPSRSAQLLEHLSNFMTKHMREITLSLLFVFGVYLIIRGFGVFGVKL